MLAKPDARKTSERPFRCSASAPAARDEHIVKTREALVQLTEQAVADDLAELGDRRIVDAIDRAVAFGAPRHHALAAHQAQMARDVGLGEAGPDGDRLV